MVSAMISETEHPANPLIYNELAGWYM